MVRQESDRDLFLSDGQTRVRQGSFFVVWSDRDLLLSDGQTGVRRGNISVGWSDRDRFLSDGQIEVRLGYISVGWSDGDLFLSDGQTGVSQGSFSVGWSDRDRSLSDGQTGVRQGSFSVGWSDRDRFLSDGQTGIIFCGMVRLIFFCRLVRQESDRDRFRSAGQTGISSLSRSQGSFSVGWSDRDLKFVCRLVRQTKTVRAQGRVAVTLLATLVQRKRQGRRTHSRPKPGYFKQTGSGLDGTFQKYYSK